MLLHYHVISSLPQVLIEHLRGQQARLEVEAETAAMLRVKQKRLEQTITSLQAQLKAAKLSHSPVCCVGV